ncbi:hypothetical protein AAC387_Pa12g1169 [Persea americana]
MAVESSLVAGEEEVNDDRISLLPDPILTMILSLIPVIDAARTSVLSKRWRYLWTSIPHLDFFNFFDAFFSGGFPTQVGEKCISVFNQIFACRRAHINSYELPIFDDCPFDLDYFFFRLDELRIQDLLLSYFGNDPINLPSLFFCNSLKKLKILCFLVRLPSQFNQLTNLQALELTFVGITSTHLEMLVAGCPRLENLTIWQCVHLSELRIRAPNLLLLDIFVEEDERRFRFSLIKAPRLKHVVLGYSLNKEFWHDFSEEEDEEDENEIDEVDNLIKLLMNLDHLESFSFRCCLHLFKFKSIMRLPDSLPIGCQLVHLKKLFMELNFDDAAMVSPLLFLLRSCPNLEQLSLKCRCSKIGFPIETNYWEKQKPPECLKSHLMTIQIEDICLSSKNVIEFVKFLLVNAHVLVRMGLLYSKSSRDQSEEDIVVNELLLFNRASQNALLEIKPGRSLYGG